MSGLLRALPFDEISNSTPDLPRVFFIQASEACSQYRADAVTVAFALIDRTDLLWVTEAYAEIKRRDHAMAATSKDRSSCEFDAGNLVDCQGSSGPE